jgi:hypothetical protein
MCIHRFSIVPKPEQFGSSSPWSMANDLVHVIRAIRVHRLIFDKITNGLVINKLIEHFLPDLHLEFDALFISFQPVFKVAHVVYNTAFDALPVFFVGEEVSANKGRWVKASGEGTVVMILILQIWWDHLRMT